MYKIGNQSYTKVGYAIELLKIGESTIDELDDLLKSMEYHERRELAKYVYDNNIPAPRCVVYDYSNQKWLI